MTVTKKTEDNYHVSLLPPILDSYKSALCPEKAAGLSECQRRRRQQSPSRTEPMAMTSAHVVDSDQVLERKRKALLDQRHLETYYRLQRLKDVLSYQYATLLREKVQRQRQEIMLQDSRLREGHKEQKFDNIQRATRSTLSHDDAYLRCLPKTRYYLVLELQKQLKRLGYLQSRREQEVFRVWTEQHRSTCQLEKQLQAMAATQRCEETLSCTASFWRASLHPADKVCPHPGVQCYRMPVSVRGRGGGVNYFQQQDKQSWGQDETELMFPEVFTRQLKVPKFSSLQSTFLEEVSSKMLLMRSHEPLIRSKTIEIKHKMRLMHNLSLSHMVDTQRIMAKNRLSLQCTDGFSIKELEMEHECPQNIPTQKSRCATEPDFTHMSEKGTSEIPESFTESPNTHFSPSLHPAGKSTDESPSSSAGDTHSSCTDVPLCITDVYSSHAVEVMWKTVR
ncbi:Microfibrillar-associated protein 5 [Labeo rohita]|uniref:Microfibrillar-associated protein 5 n=1 Tax=Labeo rohita TaxID=84645 RepID=A0ABQ8M3N3_LABRO|nr:Microfibrillar-associated protein 5 [Labeo rohita]